MFIVGSIIDWVLWVFLLLLFARMILSWSRCSSAIGNRADRCWSWLRSSTPSPIRR